MNFSLLKSKLFTLTSCFIILYSCDKDDGCIKSTWYADADNDGLGNPEVVIKSCEKPDGFVDNADDTDDTRNAINEERALALIAAFNTGDPAPLAYVSDEKYIQHNAWFKDGKEPLASLFTGSPIAKVETIRIFSFEDIVVMHNLWEGDAGFDIFRFEEGLIVEHWDNLEYTENDADVTSQTDGVKIVLKQAESYRAFYEIFAQELFINGDWTNASRYFNFSNFVEHRNGAGADGSYFSQFNEKNNLNFYNEIKFIYTSGNFGLIMSEGPDITGEDNEGVYAYFDLFRVENNLLVEHWDVVQKIPEVSENNNGKW